MLNESDLEKPLGALKDFQFEIDFPVKEITSWKVGGVVRYFKEVNSPDELSIALQFIKENKLRWAMVGRATNLLFTDGYMDGFLIRLGAGFSHIKVEGEKVMVGASSYAPCLARACANAGLGGLEHIAGIPASIGGLITMNGGSCRKSVSGNIYSVTSVDFDGQIKVRNAAECNFGYRESIFKYKNEIIIGCIFSLSPADKSEARNVCLSTMRSRRIKFPLKQPNCGSVFKSSPTMYEQHGPPGFVIEKCGLKGTVEGGAQISPLHANFIVNTGGATSKDILSLIALCVKKVAKETGHILEPEVRLVDEQLNIKNIDLGTL